MESFRDPQDSSRKSEVKNYLVKKVLIKDRLRFLEEKKHLYGRAVDDGEILDRQISRFNVIWKRCYGSIPFYREWRLKHNLPERISSVKDLRFFPALTKRVLQDNQHLIFRNGLIKQHVSTGGSTGEPTRFPWSRAEVIPTYTDIYVGRSWYGIEPLEPLLLFWGHSHLFGSGLKGVLNSYKRKLYDYLFNITRLNAYDMSPATIRDYYDVLQQKRVCFILGYTSCLYKLAKYVQENGLEIKNKGTVKAVIVTAETVTQADVELLSRVFLAPVVIEYGMAETGVIAYSFTTTWALRVFWDSFIVMKNGDGVINVTTVYDKLFPLINYRTEDIVEVGKEAEGSVLEILSVQGRRRDILRVGCMDGSYLELSGILMVHILKSYPHVFSVQFEQRKPTGVRMFLVGDRRLDIEDVKSYFLREIRKDHHNIDGEQVHITQVESIAKTVAGKEAVVRL